MRYRSLELPTSDAGVVSGLMNDSMIDVYRLCMKRNSAFANWEKTGCASAKSNSSRLYPTSTGIVEAGRLITLFGLACDIVELERCDRFQTEFIEQRQPAAIRELQEQVAFQLCIQRCTGKEPGPVQHIGRKDVRADLDDVDPLALRVVVVDPDHGDHRQTREHALVRTRRIRQSLRVVVPAERTPIESPLAWSRPARRQGDGRRAVPG